MLKINDTWMKDGFITSKGKKKFSFPDKEIYPGFTDSHTHLIQLGLKKSNLGLSGVKSKKELFKKLSIWIKNKSSKDIVIAEDWDESNWIEKEFPTKEELNRISRNKPIILRRVCGHIAIANDAALSRIPRGWEQINYSTGILKEVVVLKLNEIFPPSNQKLREAILLAQDELIELGIVSVHDMMIPDYFRAYQSLEREGKLKLFIYAFITEDYLDEIKELISSKKVKLAGIKIFMDGSIGARTAALQDYSYNSNGKGLLLKSKEQVQKLIEFANKNGYQLAFHAIGDLAIQTVLSGMEKNPKENPRRHRIEHFELARDDQIKEAVQKRIILSMQPNFLKWSKPGGLYEQALGRNYKRNNRFASILDEGGIITFGSDGMPYGPLNGLEHSTSAPFPSQKIDRKQAIKLYTEGGAFASFREKELRRLEKGGKGDLVVVDKDSIYITVINNKIEYLRS